MRPTGLVLLIGVSVALTPGCTGPSQDPGQDPETGSSDAGAPAVGGVGDPVTAPPPGGGLDYQLGGAYDPYPGTTIVERDRSAPPAGGAYSICYVNAFQTQQNELATIWDDHADLLLPVGDRGDSGDAVPSQEGDAASAWVVDEAWNEILLDPGTPERRDLLLAVERPWLDGCADAGYDAVEFDNLDSWTRSDGRLEREDALAFAGLLVAAAHGSGLAAAQKNMSDLTPAERDAVGFDFAVTEDCGQYDECDAYAALYGEGVLDVEYTDGGLAAACAALSAGQSVVRRDLDLVPRGAPGHEHATCD